MSDIEHTGGTYTILYLTRECNLCAGGGVRVRSLEDFDSGGEGGALLHSGETIVFRGRRLKVVTKNRYKTGKTDQMLI